jgi:hypothetical protein
MEVGEKMQISGRYRDDCEFNTEIEYIFFKPLMPEMNGQ